MTLLKKLLITTCAVTGIITSHQLNTMEPDPISVTIQEPVASDGQIYQLLSTAEFTNQFQLPSELIQTIAVNAHKITGLRCYQEHGSCLDSVNSLLDFITSNVENDVSIESTVNILKTCLSYSGKLLSTIKHPNDSTVSLGSGATALHATVFKYCEDNKLANLQYGINVLCQAAGKDCINFLCAQNSTEMTALNFAVLLAKDDLVKKLIVFAGDQASALVSKKAANFTALDLAKMKSDTLLFSVSKPRDMEEVFSNLDKLNRLQIIIELLKKYENTTGEKQS